MGTDDIAQSLKALVQLEVSPDMTNLHFMILWAVNTEYE